ncbi:RNA-binding cell elongation regulator Jag/EloR [Pisciglobus halotolerans]|uniref:RNA-binding protein KhpB n=1 Tax=Pisciglobus halotolerans TaxID=745365 RepID=A0A1I3DTF2_9LACT|nr:RNA-binding cell elongation regulator Jag/EloR [Pisciglobus halotolerans]SFH89975.1 spoIIIJ-associated protein [Pisciglobus halotolerans]
MDRYTAKAPTVEEAINKGLRALGIGKEEASIEIIEEGKKGFLGIGQKDAIVRVRSRVAEKLPEDVFHEPESEPNKDKEEPLAGEASVDSTSQQAVEEEITTEEAAEEEQKGSSKNDEQAIAYVADYLTNVATKLAGKATVEAERQHKQVIFHIQSEKAGVIIGKHGKVLNALQSLAQVLLHRYGKTKMVAIVNAGDYRERREEILRKLAERTASQVRQTNQPVFLEPMPAFERKIIHFYLSENEWVATHSEGKEPHRYLVVEPTDKQI